jgi:hypothetical protein
MTPCNLDVNCGIIFVCPYRHASTESERERERERERLTISLVNKTNRHTEFQVYYWYYNSTYFGQSFCPSSGASQPYNGIGTIYAAL